MEPTLPGFFSRLAMAWRLVFNGRFAQRILIGLQAVEEQERKAANPPPPERLHASGLFLLGALQREGRLIDFLQQDVAGFSDADVGAAARVIHGGCRKVLQQYVSIAPVMKEKEGSTVTIAKGFDAQKLQLTGNVAGQPPFRGALKHHGWITSEVRLPAVSEAIDPRVLAPAEVELT